MIKFFPVLLLSIICFSSCRKDEPLIVEEPEVEEPMIEETPVNAEVTFSTTSYSSYSITVNNNEMQEMTFPVLTGDTINVQVSNSCWNYIYYGLGDTIGTQLVDCDYTGITLYLNNVAIAGSYCDAPFPYACPSSTLTYIVD